MSVHLHWHLPHPHIPDRVAAVLEHAVCGRLHPPPVIVPDGHDWPGWHWPDGAGYSEAGEVDQ